MLVAIVSTAVAAYLIMGIRYALYSPQLSNTYLWGVYHVHSSMSDGLKSPKEIAVQARASGVELVLLTDHGNPNQASSNAHGGFHITPGLSIRMPSYADTFSFAAMGIDRLYASDPEAAIRSGDFFNCIRGAAEPERFEFSARYGMHRFPSGSDAPAKSTLHVEVQAAKQATRLVLKKDGVVIREITGDHLDLENPGAGVYRVEVFLVTHTLLQSNVPWILSNPIFVGTVRGSHPAQTLTTTHAELAKNSGFQQGLNFYLE
jgi:hypothetical protein